MPRPPNLTQTERRVFRAYWQDGLLDLAVGTSLALVGAGWLCGLWMAALGVPLVAVLAWRVARRGITEPRLGAVVFSARRRRDLTHGLIAILSLGLVVAGSLIARIWATQADWSFAHWFAPAIPAFIVAAMSLSCSAALGLWRFFVYGVMLAALGLGAAELACEPWWALVAGGGIIAGWGVVLLVSFLRAFPRLSNEVQD